MKDNYNRPPWWYTVIIIVMALPLFLWPFIMSGGLSGLKENKTELDNFFVGKQFFSVGFPIFAVLALYLSYKTYVQRRALSIILLIILALGYIAVPWVV